MIFTGGVATFLLGVLGYLLVASNLPAVTVLAFSLVLGGGLSNLLDRIFYGGYVVDFINLGIGSLRTGIFNAADVAITIGVLLVVFGGQRQRKPSASKPPLQTDR